MAAFGRPLQLTVRRMLPDHSPVCPVCNVGVGLLWPNSWMDQEFRMPLGMEVGLCPNDTVIDGDPAHPPPRKGAQQPPFFGPCLLWPNGRPSQQLLSCCCILTLALANRLSLLDCPAFSTHAYCCRIFQTRNFRPCISDRPAFSFSGLAFSVAALETEK